MDLSFILFIGMAAGGIIRLLLPSITPPDLLITLLLGAAGALVVACVGKAAGMYAETGLEGISGSIVGAAALMPLSLLMRGPH